MKILVRLPNWLGDMVMASGFLNALRSSYPGATVSLIVKKGLEGLVPFFPGITESFTFDKKQYPGLRGAWRFGRSLHKKQSYDLFFCLPDSFSSAFMARATGAKKRVGFRKEGRGILLTHAYNKPTGRHRAMEYISLLEQFTATSIPEVKVSLNPPSAKQDHIVVNINSEAQSRRLTVNKAVELLTLLRAQTTNPINLIGAPKEKVFVDEVLSQLPDKTGITNSAGATSLPQLAGLLGSARVMLSTDSGPAHLANALGTPVVVLFGAGNEQNTAPFQKELVQVVRLGKLPCEPCLKNRCPLYPEPECLLQLNSQEIVSIIKNKIT